MPDVLQNPGGFSFAHWNRPSDARTSNRGRYLSNLRYLTLWSSVRSEARPFGSWMLVSNVEREGRTGLVEAGTRVSADALIKASAFGCDGKVLERAVNRALQKAADDELDALEITGVTLRQNSGLDYVSIFARARAVRREPILAPFGYGVNSTT